MADRINITSPVGRIVAGSLYKAFDKNFDGTPLTVKTGPNAGQPTVRYFFALAIPKVPGQTHWAMRPANWVASAAEPFYWGEKIWQVGHTAFPAAAQRPDFAWKIEDGDSQIPNKRNRKPCDSEGWPGHWVVRFSGGFAPKIYRPEGRDWVQVMEADYIKPGFFVQVAFSVDGNGQQNNPGVYLNPFQVAFRAYGPEIVFGPNVEDAGFGMAPLPSGASLTPLAAATPMPAAPGAPAASAYVIPAFAGMPLAPAVPVVPPLPVSPNPTFLQVPPPVNAPGAMAYPVPGVPAAAVPSLPAYSPAPPNGPVAPAVATVSPSSVPAPPVAVGQMTPKANGVTREAYLAAGWSDAQLIQQGLMIG